MEKFLPEITALAEVILIDLALSADNAIAVGLAAAALPEAQRKRAVAWGVGLALVLRILFGLLTVQLLKIRGLLLAGGVLLIWIAARMGIDMRKHEQAEEARAHGDAKSAKDVTFMHALLSIIVANIALSLDNVLAVAGVSRHSPLIMAFGLVLSILLMGLAASLIARIVEKNRWIAIVGIAVIVFAGIVMAWEDLSHLFPAYVPPLPSWAGGQAHGAS